jgi:hypothetical protein
MVVCIGHCLDMLPNGTDESLGMFVPRLGRTGKARMGSGREGVPVATTRETPRSARCQNLEVGSSNTPRNSETPEK